MSKGTSNEDLNSKSVDELEEESKQLGEEIELEQQKQHSLLMELRSIDQSFDSITIPNIVKSANTPPNQAQPASGVNPQQQQANQTSTLSVLGASIANYVNKRDQGKKSDPSAENNNVKIADAGMNLSRGRMVKNLVSSVNGHMETLQRPDASKEEVVKAMKGIKDDLNNIQQSISVRLKGLKYADKKEFDRTCKSIQADLKDCQKLSDSLAKVAPQLNLRNEIVPKDSNLNFHELSSNLKEFAGSIGNTISKLAKALNPQTYSMGVS
ncbi:hypothetical protein L1D14_20470 [Vibrio tubiashii]|uniref:hypothetical protein n=1 Tax=Vibrio tubiashii TaxID=29498 RepID=UPI001EFE6BCA|nr:hypothetical protein [Vibrio tubiashii]MCG9578596.1 hypothetical protein [Vibrio tubiashii]